jgi:hypothetical protein
MLSGIKYIPRKVKKENEIESNEHKRHKKHSEHKSHKSHHHKKTKFNINDIDLDESKSEEIYNDELIKKNAEETDIADSSELLEELNESSRPLSNQSAAEILKRKLKNKSFPILVSQADKTSMIPKTNNDEDDRPTVQVEIIKKHIELTSQLATAKTGSDISLAALVAAEKLDSAAGNRSMDDIYRRNILCSGGKSTSVERRENKTDRAGADEEEDLDMSMYMDKTMTSGKQGISQLLEQQVKNAVRVQSMDARMRAQCSYCDITKHSISLVSTASNCYLSLKAPHLRITSGHCELVPRAHVPSLVNCDDDTAVELDRYKVFVTFY